MTDTELVEKPIGKDANFAVEEKEEPVFFKQKWTLLQVETAIQGWMKERDEKGRLLTVTSLARHLECDRRSLKNYRYGNKERKNTGALQARDILYPLVKKAYDRCEEEIEDLTLSGKNPAGPIFVATNHFGWENKKYERRDIHHSGKVEVVLLPQGGYNDPKAPKKALKQGE